RHDGASIAGSRPFFVVQTGSDPETEWPRCLLVVPERPGRAEFRSSISTLGGSSVTLVGLHGVAAVCLSGITRCSACSGVRGAPRVAGHTSSFGGRSTPLIARRISSYGVRPAPHRAADR